MGIHICHFNCQIYCHHFICHTSYFNQSFNSNYCGYHLGSDGYLLRSDGPCVKTKCVQCCIETRMPLSPSDIKRILKVGYGLNDFRMKLGDGWRLKNISGRRIFLSGDDCTIYPYRPEGCQLYPLIYDEDLRHAIIDHLCPYSCDSQLGKKTLG